LGRNPMWTNRTSGYSLTIFLFWHLNSLQVEFFYFQVEHTFRVFLVGKLWRCFVEFFIFFFKALVSCKLCVLVFSSRVLIRAAGLNLCLWDSLIH
jgi:hypothetical protein